MSDQPSITLNNGVKMPQLGLGVWETRDGEECIQAVKTAISLGYRSIDTASAYLNETGVGEGVRQSGVPRGEIFVTTKVNNTDHGYDEALLAFEMSMEKLAIEYVDLYLIHWPGLNRYNETWRALEHIYKSGRAKAIGVSNFQIRHLEDMLSVCTVPPAVNQIELHPLCSQKELRSFCKKAGIAVEAWSPIMKGKLDHPTLTDLAAKHGKTAAQIVLRWDIQLGIVTIPKSINASRLKENAGIFDFELSPEDMAGIDGMNTDERFGYHPDELMF